MPIGSPYVITGMEELGGRVVGYEANGGLLLGFEAQGPHSELGGRTPVEAHQGHDLPVAA